ncbi:MAG: hypothetical protein C0404_03400 [Verrucomicrobia bacterium]|nr:hypothetical protein [Verrucomicrobiota bacterium]
MDLPRTAINPIRIALAGAELEESLPLRYICASLQQSGHEVEIIEFNDASDTEATALRLVSSGADLAGFSMVFTARASEFAGLARLARARGYRGHIVAGGHFAAFNAERLLKDEPAIDSVAVGEGETIMPCLARNLGNLAAVDGLVWRNGQGSIVRNNPARPVENLDVFTRPVRLDPPATYLGMPIANMLSSRGCTHSCYFCSIAAWHELCGGRRYRMRSPRSVAMEMGELYSHGYRIFNFHDDNFLAGGKESSFSRLTELEKELERLGIAGQIAMAIKSRPDSVAEPVFRKLVDMGLFRVFLGIEAGTAEALDNLGRRQTVGGNVAALELLARLDVHACFNLLLLNPDSTLEDFIGNVRFLAEHPGNPVNFCRTEVYAGTPLEKKLRDEDRLEGSYRGYDYHIRDQRAQVAFELMQRTMYERHHTLENIHHLSMRVDYEKQLLSHFFHCPPELRSQVTEYIRAVNRRSAGLLMEIAELARAGVLPADGDIEAFRQRVQADTAELAAQGGRLLSSIHQLAGRRQTELSLGGLAGLGVAASLVLATGTAGLAQQFAEMAPVPAREEPRKQPGSGATNAVSAKPPAGDLRQIPAHVQDMQQVIGRYLKQTRQVDIEVWFDGDGRISFAAVFDEGKAGVNMQKTLSEQEKAAVQENLKKLRSAEYKVRTQATEDLKKAGFGALAQVQKTLDSTDDPEVRMRCKEIVGAIDPRVKVKGYDKMIEEIKAIPVRGGARDKSYTGTIGVVNSIRRDGGGVHMFEMIAPGPQR